MFTSNKLVERLGSGAQGEVYQTTMENIVVKIVKGLPIHDVLQVYSKALEASTAWVDCPHLVRYFVPSVAPDFSEIHLPMEKLRGGDCLKLVANCLRTPRYKPPEAQLVRIALDIASGLEFLHTKAGVVHGDVKLENIMFATHPAKTSRAVLMDFESMFVATGSKGGDRSAVVPQGTGEYISPEWSAALRRNDITFSLTPKCDIYSLGVVVLALAWPREFPGTFEWETEGGGKAGGFLSLEEFTPSVLAGVVRHCMKGYSEALLGLVLRMVCHDPKGRPCAATLVKELTLIATGCHEELLKFPRCFGPFACVKLPKTPSVWSENELQLDLPCPQCGLPLKGTFTCDLFKRGRHAPLLTTDIYEITLPDNYRTHAGIPSDAVAMANIYSTPVAERIIERRDAVPGEAARTVHTILVVGGLLYFNNDGAVVGVHTMMPHTDAHLFFSTAQPWVGAWTPQIASRLKCVHDPHLRDSGARLQCWLPPGLYLCLPNGQEWLVSDHGAVVFLFSDDASPDERDVFFAVGVPPRFPDAVARVRYFTDSLEVSLALTAQPCELAGGSSHGNPTSVLAGASCEVLCCPFTEGAPDWMRHLLTYIPKNPQDPRLSVRTMYSHPWESWTDHVGSFVVQSRTEAQAHSLVQGHHTPTADRVPLHFRRIDVSTLREAVSHTRHLKFVKVCVLDWLSRGLHYIAWLPWYSPSFHGGFVFRGEDDATLVAAFEVVEDVELRSARPSPEEFWCDAVPFQWTYCWGEEGWRKFNHSNNNALTAAAHSKSRISSVIVDEPLPGSLCDLDRMTVTHPDLPRALCLRYLLLGRPQH